MSRPYCVYFFLNKIYHRLKLNFISKATKIPKLQIFKFKTKQSIIFNQLIY